MVEGTSEWVTGWGLVEAEVGGEAGRDGVIPMLGVGPDMARLMTIPMEGTDLVLHTTVWGILMVSVHGKREVREDAVWRRNRTEGNGPDDGKKGGFLCRLSHAWVC